MKTGRKEGRNVEGKENKKGRSGKVGGRRMPRAPLPAVKVTGGKAIAV